MASCRPRRAGQPVAVDGSGKIGSGKIGHLAHGPAGDPPGHPASWWRWRSRSSRWPARSTARRWPAGDNTASRPTTPASGVVNGWLTRSQNKTMAGTCSGIIAGRAGGGGVSRLRPGRSLRPYTVDQPAFPRGLVRENATPQAQRAPMDTTILKVHLTTLRAIVALFSGASFTTSVIKTGHTCFHPRR